MLGDLHETPAAIRPWAGAAPEGRDRLGPLAGSALVLLAAAATLWLGLRRAYLVDWTLEARPSVTALLDGHLGAFLQRAPAYGGSLLIRAPFLELARPWTHDAIVVYLAGALPCVLALMAVGVCLSRNLTGLAHGRLARATAVAFCVANPIALSAIKQGHPEELLGAALCVAAVLCAQRDRAVWSGVLVGVAIANKPWGVLAAGPVLIALRRDRGRSVAAMLASASAVLAPFALIHAGGFVSETRGAGLATGWMFNPQQLWWFLGSPDGGAFEGRVGPVWLHGLGHTLPLAIMPPLSLGYAWLARRRPELRRRDTLLLLALLLFLRCALDPWDVVYYPVPFLTALLAWETLTYTRPPVMAAVASLVTWFLFDEVGAVLGANRDPQAAAFAVVAIAALAAIVRRLLSSSPVAPSPPSVVRPNRRPGQTAEASSSSATRKEEPQPQAATTLGFSTLKPAPCRPSTKSMTDPFT